MKKQPSRACKRTASYSSGDDDCEDAPPLHSPSRRRVKSTTGGKRPRKDLIAKLRTTFNAQPQHNTSDSDDKNQSSSDEQDEEDEEDEESEGTEESDEEGENENQDDEDNINNSERRSYDDGASSSLAPPLNPSPHDAHPPEFYLKYETDSGYTSTGQRISDVAARLTMRKIVRTSMLCPCEELSCNIAIKIGKLGRLGRGRWSCPHCKSYKKNKESDFPFVAFTRQQFIAHLKSKKCEKSRGIVSKRGSKKHLPRAVQYLCDNPSHEVILNAEDPAKAKKKFLCPNCERHIAYPNRFSHAEQCFLKAGKLGDDMRQLMANRSMN